MSVESMHDTSNTTTICSQCGAPSVGTDPWCNECGAPLQLGPSVPISETPKPATSTPPSANASPSTAHVSSPATTSVAATGPQATSAGHAPGAAPVAQAASAAHAPGAHSAAPATAAGHASATASATAQGTGSEIFVEKVQDSDPSDNGDPAAPPKTRYTRSMSGCPFEEGDILHVQIRNQKTRIRLVSLAFSTQLASGFFAQDVHSLGPDLSEPSESYLEGEPSVANSTYFLEVYNATQAPTDKLTEDQARLFRFAVGKGTYQGKPFRIYDESDSRSLESFLEQAKGVLPLEDVIALFRAVLDLTIFAHEQSSLIFGISPWTVRILNSNGQDGDQSLHPARNAQPDALTNISEADSLEPISSSGDGSDATFAYVDYDPTAAENQLPAPEIDEIGNQITKEGDTPAEVVAAVSGVPSDGASAPSADAGPPHSSDTTGDATHSATTATSSSPSNSATSASTATSHSSATDTASASPTDSTHAAVTAQDANKTATASSSETTAASASGASSTEHQEDLSSFLRTPSIADFIDSSEDQANVDELLANTDLYDDFLAEHLLSISDAVDEELESSIEEMGDEVLENYSFVSTAHDGELTFELERSSALLVPGSDPLDSLDSPFAIRAAETTPVDVHYRAILDGLETLYPMGVQPESVPLISGFAAAEFLLGISQMIGPQADVFSLGALLFYLVTGRVPPNSIHTHYVPAVPMRNFRPGFPPGLEAVVGRAIRIDPNRRYESVRHMRDDFEHAVGQIRQRLSDAATPSVYSVVRAAVDRHVGIAKGKRTPINQDNVFCGVEETGRVAIVVVADGVTTANYGRGDIASNYIKEAAEAHWEIAQDVYMETGTFNPREAIQAILEQANRSLVDYVNEHCLPFTGQLHEVMGSTVLIACVQDGHVTLASLGDSRAYLCTDLGLEQLTVDHNLWTLNVLDDVLPIDRAKAMPFADALARCVGSFRVAKQRLEVIPPEPDIQEFFLRSGDRLLLATDGLTDFVGINREDVEDAIHAVLRREDDPALAALELILEANRGGGGDNIGIGIIDFH